MGLVTEKTIKGYFKMMADYGEELTKTLQTDRKNCASLIKARWDMVKTACDNYGKSIVNICRAKMESGNRDDLGCAKKEITKCVDQFRKQLDESERDILNCIENCTKTAVDKCMPSKTKCQTKLKEIIDTIRSLQKEIPKIHIGNNDYDFNDLLTEAERLFEVENNNTMFLSFASDDVVNKAIGAFASANIF